METDLRRRHRHRIYGELVGPEAPELEECNSFPWNKPGDFFRTPILSPNMDKREIEAAPAGKCGSYVTSKERN